MFHISIKELQDDMYLIFANVCMCKMRREHDVCMLERRKKEIFFYQEHWYESSVNTIPTIDNGHI
jgi:hypothetical protein